MSKHHYYEPSFTRSRSKLSLTRSIKRKREEDPNDGESSEEDQLPRSSQSTWAELLPEDARQRQVAGLAADQDIPGNDFPNRPMDYKPYTGTYSTPSQIQKQLSNLKPPLIDYLQKDKQVEASRSSLKQQHINVMYTTVHKCLLERDFLRAERAFGLLLRTENLGQLPDLRNKNLWGIGAEILLHRKVQARRTNDRFDEGKGQNLFDREGVEDVRQYYEKLIIQFPYRNQQPNALSAVQIYPVLFGLWVASIDERYHAALQSIRGRSQDSGGDYSIEQIDELESIRRSILTSAQEVSKRLDNVLQSIPYSDDPVLWNLKGHIYLWINDLSKSYHGEDSLHRSSSEGPADTDPEESAQSNAQRAFAMADSFKHARERQRQPSQVLDSNEL